MGLLFSLLWLRGDLHALGLTVSPLLDVRMDEAVQSFGSQSPCAFRRISPDEIHSMAELEKLAAGRPVVLQSRDREWPLESMARLLGEIPVLVDNGRHDEGRHKKRMSIRTYVEELRRDEHNLHVFQAHPHLLEGSIAYAPEARPLAVLEAVAERPIFSMGYPGTATYFHNHAETWQTLFLGRKAWFLAPPRPMHVEYRLARTNPCEWLAVAGGADNMTPATGGPPPSAEFCVQRAGETIFFPAQWWHATCNLGPGITAGVGAQGSLQAESKAAQLAARRGHVSDTLAAVKAAGTHAVDVHRRAALDAAIFGHVDIVEALVKYNETLASQGDLALDLLDEAMCAAVEAGQLSVLELLVRLGANVSAPVAKWRGDVPLMKAARNGYANLIQYLLGLPSNVLHHISATEQNAILAAASNAGSADSVEALLGSGVNGEGALVAASKAGHVAVAAVLLKSRARIDETDLLGWQALHFSAWNGHVRLCSWLLERNANLEAKNGGTLAAELGDDFAFPTKRLSDGRRPLHLAAESGHLSAVRVLASARATLAAESDTTGKTPLVLATAAGQSSVAMWLERAVSHKELLPSTADQLSSDPKPMEL